MRYIQKTIWLLLLLLVPAHAALAGRTEPLFNVENQGVVRADGKPLTLKQVEQAILVASTRSRFWGVSPVKEGVMLGNMTINGRHTAMVDITYTTSTFSIKYRDSSNLLYGINEHGVLEIHHNYNKLVRQLRSAITQSALLIRD